MSGDQFQESNVKSTIEAVTGLVKAVPVYEDALQPAAKQVGKSLETGCKSCQYSFSALERACMGL
ncbi:hypothetical protein [Mucilaginibacter pocheonensis]|uniref:Uncharacterized protein n=1 Tax=Mucilaginibacter pocheonensis TaxID=398050 RepID=A0ABU1TCH0_9SPHI|nr:hypothetical protein [Mucilaginibacter pocheonensis]MDR6943028.1 hypothetical protein [Mucilaginibacter pocheonensis]